MELAMLSLFSGDSATLLDLIELAMLSLFFGVGTCLMLSLKLS
jgi:hypothetical protein